MSSFITTRCCWHRTLPKTIATSAAWVKGNLLRRPLVTQVGMTGCTKAVLTAPTLKELALSLAENQVRSAHVSSSASLPILYLMS